MNFLRKWGRFMLMGARAHAEWELKMSNNILGDKRRMIILGLCIIPCILGGIAFADDVKFVGMVALIDDDLTRLEDLWL